MADVSDQLPHHPDPLLLLEVQAELVSLLHLPPSAPHVGKDCGPIPAPLLPRPHTFKAKTEDVFEAITFIEIINLGIYLVDALKIVDIPLSWERAIACQPCKLRWPHQFADSY